MELCIRELMDMEVNMHIYYTIMVGEAAIYIYSNPL
jgi:hypothetical protein